MGGVRNGKGTGTPEPAAVRQEVPRAGTLAVGSTDDAAEGVARHFRAAARWLREGSAARAFEELATARRTLPMTPRLAAALVRFGRLAGAETVAIGLLEAVPPTESAEVRLAVRRQLARLLRKTGQGTRAVAVLDALTWEFPDERRARRVLEALRAKSTKPAAAPVGSVLEKLPTKKSGAQGVSIWEEDEVDYHAATVVDTSGVAPKVTPVAPPRSLTMELSRVEFQVEGPPLGLETSVAPTTVETGAARLPDVEPRGSTSSSVGDGSVPWDVTPMDSEAHARVSAEVEGGSREGTERERASEGEDATTRELTDVAATPLATTEPSVSRTDALALPLGDEAREELSASVEVSATSEPGSATQDRQVDAAPGDSASATSLVGGVTAADGMDTPLGDASTGASATTADSADAAPRNTTAADEVRADAADSSVAGSERTDASSGGLSGATVASGQDVGRAVTPVDDSSSAVSTVGTEANTRRASDTSGDVPRASSSDGREVVAGGADVPASGSSSAAPAAPRTSPSAENPTELLRERGSHGASGSRSLDPNAPAVIGGDWSQDDSSTDAAEGAARPLLEVPPSETDLPAKTLVEMPAVRLGDLSVPWNDAPSERALLPRSLAPGRPTPSKGSPAVSAPPVLQPVGTESSSRSAGPTRIEDAPRSETTEVPLADLLAALGRASAGGESAGRAAPAPVGNSGPTAPPRSGRPGSGEHVHGEDTEEWAHSQKLEAQFIARRAWKELAQLYLKRADRAKDPAMRAEALTRLAEVMETELQDPAGAARMYGEIVELTGDRVALREQVRLLASRDDASLVRRALDEAIQRARTGRARATALLTRGERWLHMGELQKARADFEAAEALVPGMVPALAGLLLCVEGEERLSLASRLRTVLAGLQRRTPDRAEALRVLARTAEEQLLDSQLAQWAWSEVLAENPESEQARERLLWLARELGDSASLGQLLRAQIARESRGPAARQARLELVATLEAAGDMEAALGELRQAVRFEPGHKEAWLLLVERLWARGNQGEAAWALEHAATATEDELEREQTWDRLARLWRESLGNAERAQVYARRAEGLRLAREEREAALPPPEPPRSATPRRESSGPRSPLAPSPAKSTALVAAGGDLSEEITSSSDPNVPAGPGGVEATSTAPLRGDRATGPSASGVSGASASRAEPHAGAQGLRGERSALPPGASSPSAREEKGAPGNVATPSSANSPGPRAGKAAPPADASSPRTERAPPATSAPRTEKAPSSAGAAPSNAPRAEKPVASAEVAPGNASAPRAERALPPSSGVPASASRTEKGSAPGNASRPEKPVPSAGAVPGGAPRNERSVPSTGAAPGNASRAEKPASSAGSAPGNASRAEKPAASTGAVPGNAPRTENPAASTGAVPGNASRAEKPAASAGASAGNAPRPEKPAASVDAAPGNAARAEKPAASAGAAPGNASRADKPAASAGAVPGNASRAERPAAFAGAAAGNAPRAEKPAASAGAAPGNAPRTEKPAPAVLDAPGNASRGENPAPRAVKPAPPGARTEKPSPPVLARVDKPAHREDSLAALGPELERPAPSGSTVVFGENAPAPRADPPPRAPRGEKPRPPSPARPPEPQPRGGKAIDLMTGGAMDLDAPAVPETRIISWEAPPGRMDPVRRVHRPNRPEGTAAGPAPGRTFIAKPPPPAAPLVGAAETRENPIVVPVPAPASDTEPEVFRQLRERPLDTATYEQLADFFDTRGDAPRAVLMREIVEALAGRETPAPRLQRPPLTGDERAGLRHPGLRTTSGELLACAGIALCRLFPAQGRAADASEPLRAVAGPGAPAVLDALHTSARILAMNLPELVLADDDGPPFTAVHTDKPRLLVGRAAIRQPLPAAELRFHAGRALLSLSPDLLALRALKGAQLLRALALLSTVLKDPKDSSADARLVRDSLSPRALERTLELLEPGTRDFNASALADAARDSANRAGLVACGGVGPAVTVIRSRRSQDSELVELLRFAASERYLALRDASR
ncbi:hypothetical protein SAMN05443572_1011418 [Myxococcus fulvus]|uniref:Uncharacterized protein n=1 Tax=Myxococcus fulvus TaxID=33 RepID=A0A511SV49_MYXFU|nr:hypothetical protein [Myxococcus fulvus]GEN05038.1 hypothetical protein MFU01_00750 [Myxococcus fulvus]SET20008.1 hypothetical protein SAMN05443572_1011418 [Myxococcus fulvus]